MAFVLSIRQGPARLAQRLPRLLCKASPAAPSRSFHKPMTGLLSSRIAASAAAARGAFARRGGRRAYQQGSPMPSRQGPSGQSGDETRSKLLIGGAVFGGTLVAINAVFNSESREGGAMPVYEREYLNSTFMHTGLGIGIIGLTAWQMAQSGFVYRLIAANPLAVGLGGLALSFATMIGTRAISPDKYVPFLARE